MNYRFQVQHLDIDRLLANWRWLCPGPRRLSARSAFGDLFLTDEAGHVSKLDVAVGKLTKIADSEDQFRELLANPQNRNEWFGEEDELGFRDKGLVPNGTQSIGFSPPLVVAEKPHQPYLIDIYENVSFLGDLNHQIANVPDGGKIKLIVGERSTVQ
jgi:hypothetical protein